ncbi:unnamed protein product [Discosporangium mesarthrocarpum]
MMNSISATNLLRTVAERLLAWYPEEWASNDTSIPVFFSNDGGGSCENIRAEGWGMKGPAGTAGVGGGEQGENDQEDSSDWDEDSDEENGVGRGGGNIGTGVGGFGGVGRLGLVRNGCLPFNIALVSARLVLSSCSALLKEATRESAYPWFYSRNCGSCSIDGCRRQDTSRKSGLTHNLLHSSLVSHPPRQQEITGNGDSCTTCPSHPAIPPLSLPNPSPAVSQATRGEYRVEQGLKVGHVRGISQIDYGEEDDTPARWGMSGEFPR